jgi:hypothetical protein
VPLISTAFAGFSKYIIGLFDCCTIDVYNNNPWNGINIIANGFFFFV